MMPIAFLYAGFLINVIARGDFPDRVYEAVRSEVPSLKDGTFNLQPLPDLEESIRKSKRGTKAVIYTWLGFIVAIIIFAIIAVKLS